MVFSIPILSSNGFSILTLRQASFDRLRTEQGERIEKHDFDKRSGQAGRTDWKGALRRASFDKLRTEQGEWTGKEAS
jgi:hypothetical protein